MVGNNNGSVTVCFGFLVLSLFSHYLLFSLLRERAKKLPVMCFIAQNKKHRQMPKKGFPTRQKKANKKIQNKQAKLPPDYDRISFRVNDESLDVWIIMRV